MHVFRVETLDGNGPYQTSNLSEEQRTQLLEMYDDHSDIAEHPSPWLDRYLGDIKKDEYCGFVSVGQLRQWFNGWLDILTEQEFVVTVYDVPCDVVRASHHQALIRNVADYPQVAVHLPSELG